METPNISSTLNNVVLFINTTITVFIQIYKSFSIILVTGVLVALRLFGGSIKLSLNFDSLNSFIDSLNNYLY